MLLTKATIYQLVLIVCLPAKNNGPCFNFNFGGSAARSPVENHNHFNTSNGGFQFGAKQSDTAFNFSFGLDSSSDKSTANSKHSSLLAGNSAKHESSSPGLSGYGYPIESNNGQKQHVDYPAAMFQNMHNSMNRSSSTGFNSLLFPSTKSPSLSNFGALSPFGGGGADRSCMGYSPFSTPADSNFLTSRSKCDKDDQMDSDGGMYYTRPYSIYVLFFIFYPGYNILS